MEINKVVFGNFSIGAKANNTQQQEVKDEAQKAQTGVEQKDAYAESVFSAMNIAGMQNMTQIARAERKEINPADYLSADRIADIEAMMGKFDDGVGTVADTIEQELPGFFAADVKNALAAKIFAAG